MSKINIAGIVRDIKGRTTYLTTLIEAICNSIDAIGGKSDGLIEIVVKHISTSHYEIINVRSSTHHQ